MSDTWAVACNFRLGTKIASPGAQAFVAPTVAGNGSERIDILVRSRSGRMVRKWEDIRRLWNFRAKCIPDRHPLHGDERVMLFPGRMAAQAHADMLTLCCRRESTARPKRAS